MQPDTFMKLRSRAEASGDEVDRLFAEGTKSSGEQWDGLHHRLQSGRTRIVLSTSGAACAVGARVGVKSGAEPAVRAEHQHHTR